MTEGQPKRLHAYVEGRVQGVGFRAFAQIAAQRLDLTGWVRNLPDGRVELVAEGSQANLDQFLHQLQQGPALAWVFRVVSHLEEATGEFDRFQMVGY